MTQSIFEYTRDNILVIPQALFAMQDVRVLRQYGDSVIFYKCPEQDLIDIEFYTSTPCLVYIESGVEVLTNSQNQTIELQPGSAIFLPQGVNLHSDYVKKTSTLQAYLVFFDQSVITEFLTCRQDKGKATATPGSHCIIQDATGDILAFFNSIHSDIHSQAYFRTKLLELLHLVAWKSDQQEFLATLLSRKVVSPKRNLMRLLDRHDVLHLSVSDLARISGRSLSSFNRDFKTMFQATPYKWLRERRLAYARELLDSGEVSVTEAASEVGYENVSNFIKAFKGQYGQTPKQIKMCK